MALSQPSQTARVAVVTGAANGIGAAIAARLRDDGLMVVGLDVESCEFEPSLTCDVSQIEGHQALIEGIVCDHGPLWALVNVAGISIPEALEDLTVEAYRRQHGVMLDGPDLAGPRSRDRDGQNRRRPDRQHHLDSRHQQRADGT